MRESILVVDGIAYRDIEEGIGIDTDRDIQEQIEKDYKDISNKTLSKQDKTLPELKPKTSEPKTEPKPKTENIKQSDEEKLSLIQSMIHRKREAYFSLNNSPDDFSLNNNPPDDGWDDDTINAIVDAW